MGMKRSLQHRPAPACIGREVVEHSPPEAVASFSVSKKRDVTEVHGGTGTGGTGSGRKSASPFSLALKQYRVLFAVVLATIIIWMLVYTLPRATTSDNVNQAAFLERNSQHVHNITR